MASADSGVSAPTGRLGLSAALPAETPETASADTLPDSRPESVRHFVASSAALTSRDSSLRLLTVQSGDRQDHSPGLSGLMRWH